MTYLVIAAAVALFCLGLRLFRLVPHALDAMATARSATGVMRSPDLDDDTKEVEVQRAALKLFKLFALITLGIAGALALSALAIWLADLTGLATASHVIDVSLSWPVLIVTLVVMTVVMVRFR